MYGRDFYAWREAGEIEDKLAAMLEDADPATRRLLQERHRVDEDNVRSLAQAMLERQAMAAAQHQFLEAQRPLSEPFHVPSSLLGGLFGR